MSIALIALGFLALVVAIIAVRDLTQRHHAVTRNFPVVGHFRYFWRPRGTSVQPRHALLGLRLCKGAEQHDRLRIPG